MQKAQADEKVSQYLIDDDISPSHSGVLFGACLQYHVELAGISLFSFRPLQYAIKSMGEGSVYSFFLHDNKLAWSVALVTVALQFWMLHPFIIAAGKCLLTPPHLVGSTEVV